MRAPLHQEMIEFDLMTLFVIHLFSLVFFFQQEQYFLSQQISQNSVSAWFFSEANVANIETARARFSAEVQDLCSSPMLVFFF